MDTSLVADQVINWRVESTTCLFSQCINTMSSVRSLLEYQNFYHDPDFLQIYWIKLLFINVNFENILTSLIYEYIILIFWIF